MYLIQKLEALPLQVHILRAKAHFSTHICGEQ